MLVSAIFGGTASVQSETRRSTFLHQETLSAVAADRFDRATFHRLFTKTFFLRRFRLFVNVGMAAVIVALEIRRRSFAAQIAVDALFVDIEFAGSIFGIFVGGVGHNFLPLREWEVSWKRASCNSKAESLTGVAAELEAA